MKLKLFHCVFFILITSICLADARAGEYRVWPMLIDISAEPGGNYPFEFNVLAIKSGRIRVHLNKVEQLSSGHVQFVASEKIQGINLVNTKASLDAGETFIVQGEIIVPRKSSGSLLYAVIIEEDNTKKGAGLQIKVRYAVVIDVDIKSRKTKLQTKIYNLEIIDGNISAWFENHSNKKARLKSQLVIRDENQRLVDRQLLMTQSAIERQNDHSIIHPNSVVKILGSSDKLTSGIYNVLIQSNFDEKSLPVLRSKIDYIH